MVIFGSENIYPAEIEAFIHEMTDITDGDVVGKPDDKWEKYQLLLSYQNMEWISQNLIFLVASKGD